jgi:prepilin peptidase CpaA
MEQAGQRQMIASIILLGLLPVILAYACFSDLFTMRISNRVCLAVLALFPAAAVSSGMEVATIGWHLLAGAAALAVSFTLFATGHVGGGDAKLVPAIVVWLGFDQMLEFVALFCVLGGALTLGLLIARRQPLPSGLMTQPWIAKLHAPTTGVPYGVALGIAALIVLPESPVWRLAI